MPLTGEYVPSTSGWVRDQIAAYEASGGTEAATLRETGIPVIIVTFLGKEPGTLRKIALMRVEHEGDYALIASMGGAPKNPAWYHSLVRNPDHVTIQDGPEPFDVTVRLVEGDERQTWFDRGVEVFPTYAEYAEKTDRTIPIFVTTRV